MGLKTFSRGDIIFRQGDPGDCMYDIQFGTIAIYIDFGGANEQKIAELSEGQIFGEMSIIDYSPRTATAVACVDGTELLPISKGEFVDFFKKEPAKILEMLQQMCDRVKATTQDYVEACQTLEERQKAAKNGAEKDSALQAKIEKFSNMHKNFNSSANA